VTLRARAAARGWLVVEALEYGVRIAGATVHFVDEETDHGPIILQGAVIVARTIPWKHSPVAVSSIRSIRQRFNLSQRVDGRSAVARCALREKKPPRRAFCSRGDHRIELKAWDFAVMTGA
jgi:hypothetical protein